MEKFQREPASVELIDELIPSFVAHDRAVSHYPDIPLNPDYETFLAAEKANRLRVFTARDENSEEILGYSVFFVSPHLHKKATIQAEESALFIHPEVRGFGPRFISWTEEQLFGEGVEIVVRHAKARPDLNFSPMLERKGYELKELVWFKRKEIA